MKSAMMRVIGVSVVAGVLGLAYGVAPLLIAQEAGKEAAKSEKGEKKGAKKEGKADSQSLPDHFGKVGLSDEQKKKIYAIQDQYEIEIKDLQKKLADLKTKQIAECEAVLTAAQKQSLQEHAETSKKKASEKSEKKKEGEKKKDGEKKEGEKKAEKSS